MRSPPSLTKPAATNELWSVMRKRRAELERLSSLNHAVSTASSFQTPTVTTSSITHHNQQQPAAEEEEGELEECDGDDEVKDEFEVQGKGEGIDPCLTAIYNSSENSTHLFHTGDPLVLKYIDNPMFQRNSKSSRTSTVPMDHRAVNTVEYIVQSKLQQLQLMKEEGYSSDESTRTGLLGLIDSLTQDLATLIESLQLSLTEKETKVSWLEEEMNTQCDALHTEIDDLKQSCSDKNDKLRELHQAEDQLNATNQALTEHIATLDATVMEKDGILTDITTQLHTLTVRVEHADTLVANKDILIEDFRQQIHTLTTSIATQKTVYDERQQQVQLELQTYHQKEAQLTTETKALTDILAERDNVHANLIMQIDELKATITQQEERNIRLLSDVTTATKAVSIRDDQVKSLDTEVSSLKEMVLAFEKQGEKYSTELNMLQENVLTKEQQRKMAIQERDSLNDMIAIRKQETVLLEQQVVQVSFRYSLILSVRSSSKRSKIPIHSVHTLCPIHFLSTHLVTPNNPYQHLR